MLVLLCASVCCDGEAGEREGGKEGGMGREGEREGGSPMFCGDILFTALCTDMLASTSSSHRNMDLLQNHHASRAKMYQVRAGDGR